MGIIRSISFDIDLTYYDILDFDIVEVDPKTCGRYTDLTDKNGTKIFEGDIIKYKGEFLEVRYSDEQARFLTVFLNGVYDPNPVITMTKGEIIGNVHDARVEAEKALNKQKRE